MSQCIEHLISEKVDPKVLVRARGFVSSPEVSVIPYLPNGSVFASGFCQTAQGELPTFFVGIYLTDFKKSRFQY